MENVWRTDSVQPGRIRASMNERRHKSDEVYRGDMAEATTYEYITRREDVLGGEPIIEGTRTPVRAIVEEWRLGTPPEQIPDGMPHLTLAQVFAALSFYSDHQDEVNAYIEQNRISDALRGSSMSGDELPQRTPDEDASQ